MRRIFRILLGVLLATTLATGIAGCQDNGGSVWDDMPKMISEFIARYFPEQGVSKFITADDGDYMVTIKDGPSIIFDPSQQWLSINGNGETLPPMLLFDQLPPALYAYLQDDDAVDGVYKISRDGNVYDLTLLNTIVRYDIDTGLVTEPYS